MGQQGWYPNSAAASHMTPDDFKLLSKSFYSGNTMVKVGDDNLVPISHTGTFVLPTRHKPLTLSNVLHVPKLQHNLLSIRQLCRDNDCHVVFYFSCVHVKDNTTSNVLLQASSSGLVYVVPVPTLSNSMPTNVILTELGNLWYCCWVTMKVAL